VIHEPAPSYIWERGVARALRERPQMPRRPPKKVSSLRQLQPKRLIRLLAPVKSFLVLQRVVRSLLMRSSEHWRPFGGCKLHPKWARSCVCFMYGLYASPH
jgi:hypothetical protein